jgi:hypothetical protein
MLQVPEAMQAYWEKKVSPKVTPADIALIESVFGKPLPASYVEFVTQYGFVVFDDVPGMLCYFDYRIVPSKENKFATENEIGRGDIAFLYEPEELIKAYEICTTRQAYEEEKDEMFPKFPRNYLPIGNDAGQGTILMEISEKPGRIWFWYENEWAWGMEDNTWLGFVADDFKDFINGLKP